MKQTVSFVKFIDQLLVNLSAYRDEFNYIQPHFGDQVFSCFAQLNDQAKTVNNFFGVIKNNLQLFGSEQKTVFIWAENVKQLLVENKSVTTVVKTVLNKTQALVKSKVINLGQKRIWDLLFHFFKYFLSFVSVTNQHYKLLDKKTDELYLRLVQLRARFGNWQFSGQRSEGKTTAELALVYIFLQSFISACQN